MIKLGRGGHNDSERRTAVVQVGPDTITITGEALDFLTDLAEHRGVSLTDVLSEAIAIQKALVEEQAHGGRVIVERADRKPRELVLATS